MRSFKSFLTEERGERVHPQYQVVFQTSTQLTPQEWRPIDQALLQLPNVDSVTNDIDEIIVKFEFTSADQYTPGKRLIELRDKIQTIITDELEGYERDNKQITAKPYSDELRFHGGLPIVPIVGDNYVTIYCTGHVILSGIEKLISDVDTLTLMAPNKLKPQGVLSLFRLKDVREILFFTPGTDPEWIKIVRKHLEGDRDVMECQEELFDAGLKKYGDYK